MSLVGLSSWCGFDRGWHCTILPDRERCIIYASCLVQAEYYTIFYYFLRMSWILVKLGVFAGVSKRTSIRSAFDGLGYCDLLTFYGFVSIYLGIQ